MTIEQTTTPSGELQKPSALMRKGIAIRPAQCFGDFYNKGGTCAVGAIYEGLTGKQPPSVMNGEYEATDEMFIAIEKATGLTMPRTGNNQMHPIVNEIFDRNDRDRHPREKTADWLESIGW